MQTRDLVSGTSHGAAAPSELLALAQEPAAPSTTKITGAGRTMQLPRGSRGARAARSPRESRVRSRSDEMPSCAAPNAAVAEGENEEAKEWKEAEVLLRLLLAWRARGELEMHLATLDTGALEAWHRVLIETPRRRGGGPVAAGARRTLCARSWRRTFAGARDLASTLRRRIAAAVEAVECLRVRARRRGAPRGASTQPSRPRRAGRRRARDRGARRKQNTSARTREPARRPARAAPSPATPTTPTGTAPNRARSRRFKFLRAPAFLCWARSRGSATGSRSREPRSRRPRPKSRELLPLRSRTRFLRPPDAAWRRTPADERAAAAFAGLDGPPPAPPLRTLRRTFAQHVAPLDSVIAQRSSRAIIPAVPSCSGARPTEAAATDSRSSRPTASSSWPARKTGRRCCPRPVASPKNFWLVPRGVRRPFDPAAELNAAAAVHHRRDRPRAASLGASCGGRAASVGTRTARIRASRARPVRFRAGTGRGSCGGAVARAGHRARGCRARARSRLERSVTLAAALALGTLAWTLWRGRELTTPLLALERFGDLGARVRFGERSSACSCHWAAGATTSMGRGCWRTCAACLGSGAHGRIHEGDKRDGHRPSSPSAPAVAPATAHRASAPPLPASERSPNASRSPASRRCASRTSRSARCSMRSRRWPASDCDPKAD